MATRRRTLAVVGLLVLGGGGWVGSADRHGARAPSHSVVAPPVTSGAGARQRAVHRRGVRAALSSQALINLTPVGADTTWAVTESAQQSEIQRVLRSTDSGGSWSDVTPPGLRRATVNTTLSSTFFVNRRTGWVAYGNEQTGPTHVVETTDAGHMWSKRAGLDITGCELQFVNADEGWCSVLGGALGSEGVSIYRTTNGGRRWRLISVTNPPGDKSTPGSLPFECDKQIHFSTPTLGFAGFVCNGGPPVIYASTDGGARWTQRSISMRGVPRQTGSTFVAAPVSVGADAAASVVIAGYKQVRSQTLIFRSTNRGRSWRAVIPPGRRTAWGADVVTPTVWRLILNRTILATNNAGRTWTQIHSNKRLTTSTQSTAVHFVTRLVGWDTSSGGPDLLHTTDGGHTWKRVRLPGGSI